MAQQVMLHGDVSHTRVRRGAHAGEQRQDLGEAISFTTPQGRHILVDAGQLGSALHEKLRRPVDVLLLTHNDQDHVGGVRELLRSRESVREVWLPYDWYLLYSAGSNLVDAIRDGDTDLEALASQAHERVTSAIGMLRHHLVEWRRIDELADSPPVYRLGWLDIALASLKKGAGAEVVNHARLALGDSWIGDARGTAQSVTSGGAPGRRARATVRAVDAVLKWRGPTAWFSVDHASASTRTAVLPWMHAGLPGEFTVVNARKVMPSPLPAPPTAADAYALMAVNYQLTVQNRRALVALGHTQFGCGHVLFASDSAFEFDQFTGRIVPWPEIGAAVGLHHGSADNMHDHVYEQFRGTVLARSGSRPVLWTHSKFTRVPPESRGCTWCHANGSRTGGRDRHLDVLLEARHDCDWRILAGACIDCPWSA